MPPVTARIFPSAENPLIPRSRALRFAGPVDKIGKRLSDHGGFSLSEPSFEESRPGKEAGRRSMFELPGALP